MVNISLELIRSKSDKVETIGVLSVLGLADSIKLATLELPNLNNARSISCIPIGIYKCKKVEASVNIPYPHIWIMDVVNRDGIKIHRVNYVRQLRGCIGVGLKHVDLDGDGELDVEDSKKALDKLLAILPNEFDLTIKEA